MSFKKLTALVIVFFICFIGFAIALLPASVAIQLGQSHLPKGLNLGPATGSIWQGQVNGVQYQGQYLSRVKWDIYPSALLGMKLKADVIVGNKRNTGEVSANGLVKYGLSDGALQLEHVRARVALETVLSQVKLPVPTEAKGLVFLELDTYELGQPHCGEMAGVISSADINVKGRNGWFSIGELEGELSCVNGSASVKVSKENLLGLQVDAGFNQRGQLTVDGFIKPDASLPKDVHDAVQFIGNQSADGRYRISF